MRGKGAIEMPRLCKAMAQARLSLRIFRENRLLMVKQYVGANYSLDGAELEVFVNLIALYIDIVGRNLIAKDPRVMLTTFERDSKPTVHAMEQWANDQVEEMRLANTIKRIVTDALFSVGIAKVALASPADSSSVAWNQPAGRPFCERIDLDDFVFDVHARDFNEAGFIGHRYRVRSDVAKKMFGKAARDLDPTPDNFYNAEGDERIDVLVKGYYSSYEEYADFIDLWEVYLPHERLVVTLADADLSGAQTLPGGQKALKEQKWIGPNCGPYHILGYGTVPGNAMPKGKIPDLFPMHKLENNIYRKLNEQARRQKEVGLIQGGATEDGQRIQKSSDGDLIRCDNPAATHFLAMGGVNQGNQQFGIHIWDLFAKMAGNLEMMGGLAPQSKTLGQDQMLQANASGGILNMQQETLDFVSNVGKALCWYWWHDPTKVAESAYPIPGLNMAINRKVTPQQRQKIPWERLRIKVDPYSLQHQTPQQKLAALNAFVQQSYVPMAQMYQQAGMMLDLQAFAKMTAQYLDMPELEDLITMQEPPQQEPEGGGMPGQGKPAETTRNYVRRSLGGDTAQNREATTANMSPNGNGQKPQGVMQ